MSGVVHALKNPVKAISHLVRNPASALVPKSIRNSSIYRNVARPFIKVGTGAAAGFLAGGPVGALAGGVSAAAGGGLTNKPFNPTNSVLIPAAAGLAAGAFTGQGVGGQLAGQFGGGTSAGGNIQNFLANPASAGAGQTSSSVLSGGGSVLGGLGNILGGGSSGGGGLGGVLGGGGSTTGNLLKVGGQVLGAVYGARNARAAANDQANAARLANQTTREFYYQNRADLAPWKNFGESALGQLGGEALGQNAPLTRAFTTADFQADPGYQFRKSEGQKAVDNRLASMGMNQSGQSVKEASRFNQGIADQAYQGAYNRFNQDQTNRFNRLNTMSNTGVNAAGRVANLGANAAQSIAGNQVDIGNANAAGRIGSSNAYLNALNNIQQIGANNRFNNAIGGAY